MAKKKPEPMARIAVRMRKPQIEKLDRLAQAAGMERSEYMRHIITVLPEPLKAK